VAKKVSVSKVTVQLSVDGRRPGSAIWSKHQRLTTQCTDTKHNRPPAAVTFMLLVASLNLAIAAELRWTVS